MATVHPGATLTPHFRDFLPGWLRRQPWFRGVTTAVTPVGYFRFEDPEGQVGVETHLMTDGSMLYQVPMTYRDAPLASAAGSLITTAEHSVLGTRWIYDGTADPVWVSELLRLVRTGGTAQPSGKRGVGPASAVGHAYRPWSPDAVTLDLRRVVDTGPLTVPADAVGTVTGTWHPGGSEAPAVSGYLAFIRTAP